MSRRCCCTKSILLHVYNASEQRTVGWWCPKCNFFDKAIGRERQLGITTDIQYHVTSDSMEPYTKGDPP